MLSSVSRCLEPLIKPSHSLLIYYIKNSLNITIQQREINSDGRFIVLKADVNNEIYTIANIYGPNKDADAIKFYRNLSKLLGNDEFGNEENIIIGGDFNCPLDITLEKKGGLPIPRKYVINSIDELQNEFSLHDIWRLKNPTLQSFTCAVHLSYFAD